MKGTVAPLQGISKAVGSIPIIGKVLTGKNSDGIFGAKYTIKGPLSKPEVDIKTASTFTPGLLRDLFFSGEALEKTIEKENQKKAIEDEMKEEIEQEEDKSKDNLDAIRGI
jgi:hypothetical protein